MGCCGQQRAALSTARRLPRDAAARPPRPRVGAGPVALRFVGNGPVRVRGTASGRVYRFANAGEVQHVDARDAAALLRTRVFMNAPG
jgi:hypothetical protein